jgi:hypothetical protein
LIRSDLYWTALNALECAGVSWVLMRASPDNFLDAIEIDIYVTKHQKRQAVATLLSLGWGCLHDWLHEPEKACFAYIEQGQLNKIDIHFEVVSGGVITVDSNWFEQGIRVSPNGVRIPSESAWLLHVLTHTILTKQTLPERYFDRVRAALDNPAVVAEVRSNINFVSFADNFNALSADDAINFMSDSAWVSEVRSALLKETKRHRFVRNFVRRMEWIFSRPWRRDFGISIAVIGVDGVGKSSFISEMQEQLRDIGFVVRTAYMGPWDRSIFPTSKLLEYFGANPLDFDQIQAGPVSLDKSSLAKKGKGYVKRYFYYFGTWLETWARFLRLVLPHRLLRRIVLHDRDFLDLLTGFRNMPIRNSPRLREWLARITPRPDVIIVLLNDPGMIYERKPEYPLDVIEGAVRRYQDLASRYGLRIIITDRPTDTLVRDFIAENWRKIYAAVSGRR